MVNKIKKTVFFLIIEANLNLGTQNTQLSTEILN